MADEQKPTYIEESSFQSAAIQGASTTIAGFAGPCRYGPVEQPQLVTSLAEFERIYGGGQPLVFRSEQPGINYLWQAARAFFAQGGVRLYITRLFNAGKSKGLAAGDFSGIRIRARFPGEAGNIPVRLTLWPGGKGQLPKLSVTIPSPSKGPSQQWTGLSMDPRRKTGSVQDSVFAVFAEAASLQPGSPTPIVISHDASIKEGSQFLSALVSLKPALRNILLRKTSTDDERSLELTLSGGNDGSRPRVIDYGGGLKAFENVPDISIVAAPGATAGIATRGIDAAAVIQLLIDHATSMRYRFAVLDCGDQQSVSAVRAQRAQFNSSYAALYYPWVLVVDPISGKEISLPPSGFVAGIYVRNDIEKSVSRAPANEVVALATGFEQVITQAQQEVLNPEGINCFRTFAGRGNLLWGARTISSDADWKYVNVRRYLAYLEHSIDQGIAWTVFEPNNEALWAKMRDTIGAFLTNEWRVGGLIGAKPEQAFFVNCDRTTMTQDDIDNGRMICLIGVAPLRPAEFVIFRIGQWTREHHDD